TSPPQARTGMAGCPSSRAPHAGHGSSVRPSTSCALLSPRSPLYPAFLVARSDELSRLPVPVSHVRCALSGGVPPVLSDQVQSLLLHVRWYNVPPEPSLPSQPS